MSLGGYKFVGFKYVRPNSYTGTDDEVKAEILKIHKGKLKAFLDSCAASGAEWAFSHTDGDLHFQSYGKVIFKLDLLGFNLVSFFRYGSEDAYFAIISLSDAATTSGRSLQLANYYYYYDNSTLNMITVDRNNFYCMSLADLTITNINTMPTLDRLAIDNYGHNGLWNTQTNLEKYIVDLEYVGYATKGKAIIQIRTSSLSGNFRAKICAIDCMKMSSPNDNKNIFQFATGSTISSSASLDYNAMNGYIQTLNYDGVPYELDSHSSNTGKNAGLFVTPASQSICNSPGSVVPYEQVVITPGVNRTAGTFINNDGILSKGRVNIDLLATNNVFPTTNFVGGATFANGNYLYIGGVVTTSADAATRPLSRIYYCGWDPSNPDITQESAWTEYTE